MNETKNLVMLTLDNLGFNYEERGEECVSFAVAGDNCSICVNVLCKEQTDLLGVYGTLLLLVPSDKRSEVLRLMNERNHRSKLTTLYFDPDDGQVLCRCGAFKYGGVVNDTVVQFMLSAVINEIDEVYPEIVSICEGD